MKIALQMGLLPGSSVRDKVQWAADHGVDGVELGNDHPDALRRTADEVGGILPITTVCGNKGLKEPNGFNFLDPDKAKRWDSIEASRGILEFCGEVGAAGQICPPIFGGPRVPDLSPWLGQMEVQEQLCIAVCRELGPFAAAHGVKWILEPLNRYEQHYLRKQSDGIRMIEAAGCEGLGLLSDLFHMHIEETSTPDALRQCAGKYTTSMHLADNTRMEPGTGDIDFVAAFTALAEVGYRGYMAYECGISGATPEEKAANLATSVAFIKDCIAQAKAAVPA